MGRRAMRLICLAAMVLISGSAFAEAPDGEPPSWAYLGDWLGALATFLAVLVALRLHVLIFPPKLKLDLRSQYGERTTAILTQSNDQGVITATSKRDARYYHLVLSNTRPWSVATDVDVYIVSVENEDASGQYTELWSGSLPIVATHYGLPPSRTLGAAATEYDLCSVVKDKWLELHPRIVPNNFPNRSRVEEGKVKYRVTFQGRSLEVLSPRFAFELAWDGKWDDDRIAMSRHMVVKPCELAEPGIGTH